MANDFKNAIKAGVGTTAVEVYAPPTSKSSILIECDIANKHTSAITASVTVTDVSTSPDTVGYLVKDAPIPVGGSLQAIAGQKIVLEPEDKLKVQTSVNGSADVVCSILEDVNTP
mgnify:CR=1 FL=1